jgi:hypothetical protein
LDSPERRAITSAYHSLASKCAITLTPKKHGEIISYKGSIANEGNPSHDWKQKYQQIALLIAST